MTRVVLSLRDDATLAEAAELMASTGVHRVPILSRAGAVVGIVSTSDVARWLTSIVAD